MGDGAEQVRPHLYLFILQPEPILLLGLCRQSAGHQRDHQKGEDRQRIARDGKVESHIGICKHIIDADNAQDRGDQAKQVAVGKTGDQQHGQHIDRRGEAVRGVGHLMQQHTDACGAEKDERRDEKVPPGKGENVLNTGFGGLQGKLTSQTLGLNSYYNRKSC